MSLQEHEKVNGKVSVTCRCRSRFNRHILQSVPELSPELFPTLINRAIMHHLAHGSRIPYLLLRMLSRRRHCDTHL